MTTSLKKKIEFALARHESFQIPSLRGIVKVDNHPDQEYVQSVLRQTNPEKLTHLDAHRIYSIAEKIDYCFTLQFVRNSHKLFKSSLEELKCFPDTILDMITELPLLQKLWFIDDLIAPEIGLYYKNTDGHYIPKFTLSEHFMQNNLKGYRKDFLLNKAYVDSFGVRNRNYLKEIIKGLFVYPENQEQLSKNLQRSAIIFLDLNKFKKFNDTFGQNIGDQLIGLVCATMTEFSQNSLYSLVPINLGGDEMMFFIHSDTQVISQKIIDSVMREFKKLLGQKKLDKILSIDEIYPPNFGFTNEFNILKEKPRTLKEQFFKDFVSDKITYTQLEESRLSIKYGGINLSYILERISVFDYYEIDSIVGKMITQGMNLLTDTVKNNSQSSYQEMRDKQDPLFNYFESQV